MDRGSSALDLLLQIYSSDALGTEVPRHTYIPGCALLFKKPTYAQEPFSCKERIFTDANM